MDKRPEVPLKIWVNPADLSVHFEQKPGHLLFERVPRHKLYKTDQEIEEIRRMFREGKKQKEIARILGIHPRTVRKYTARS